MPAEPRWLTEQELVEANLVVVKRTGEPHGVLEMSRVSNAASAPRNLFHYGGVTSFAHLSVRLLEAIVQNHPFRQGNKRTAFFSAAKFLDLNGCIFAIPDKLAIAEEVEALIEHRNGPERLQRMFEVRVVPPKAR